MDRVDTITQWIQQLPTGDEVALQKLHARLWPQLIARARKRMQHAPLRMVDEEDVVQSAFWDFYQAVQQGGVPRLENRENLLALLTTMISHKAINHIKHQLTQKRGGGKLQHGSVFEWLEQQDDKQPIDEVMLADTYDHFLAALPDQLRPFSELYLAGYTHQEIADQLGCVSRTSERKVALAIEHWRQLAQRELQ
ncbi:MAG TPA: sigma-70 family RNA polymerase sigma factor [Pirellulaceae bacterium]|nr:sigma-70 family RNA polymerase sigma factor [Pirellulaceae bacterium]